MLFPEISLPGKEKGWADQMAAIIEQWLLFLAAIMPAKQLLEDGSSLLAWAQHILATVPESTTITRLPETPIDGSHGTSEHRQTETTCLRAPESPESLEKREPRDTALGYPGPS